MQKLLIEKTDLWLPLATARDYGFGRAVIVKCKIHVGLVSTGAYKMAQKQLHRAEIGAGVYRMFLSYKR